MSTLRAVAVGTVVGALLAAGAMRAEEAVRKKSCGAHIADDAAFVRSISAYFVAAADAAEAHADVVAKVADAHGPNAADALVEANGLRTLARSWRDLAGDAARSASLMQRSSWWPAVPHDERALASDPRLHDARRRAISYARDTASAALEKAAQLEDEEALVSEPKKR